MADPSPHPNADRAKRSRGDVVSYREAERAPEANPAIIEAPGAAIPALATDDAEAHLRALDEELNRMRRAMRLLIQQRLLVMAGRSMADAKKNRAWVQRIHGLLDRHGLRVQCPECGHPAILRVSPRRGSRRGAFVYDHTINGKRTFHGGRGVLPTIRLVMKPDRKIRVTKTARLPKNSGDESTGPETKPTT